MSPARTPRSTVPSGKPARRHETPAPPKQVHPPSSTRVATARPAPRRDVASIIDQSGTSLVDVIDNLLNRGVVLNADLILALANVDLVYVRLSALLCAADRLLPRARE